MLTRYSPFRFVPFYLLEKHGEREDNTPRRWRTILGMEEIQYLPEDIDGLDEDAALGRTAHEIWHVLFSRPEIIFEEPELSRSMAFQALWWAVEDPRVNNLGLARHPGAKRWLAAAYENEYSIKDIEAERERWQEIPLHLQFNYALIYRWWTGKEDPRVVDERVKDALARAAKAIARASAEPDAKKAFTIVKNEIWPIYQELLDEASKDMQKGDGEGQEGQEGQEGGEGQDGDSQQGGSQSPSGKPSKGKPKAGKKGGQKKPMTEEQAKRALEEASKKFRDEHASKLVDSPEKMSDAQREQAKKELEELREKMGQKQDGQEGQQGQKGDKGEKGEKDSGEAAGKSAGQSEPDPAQTAKQKERLNKADETHKDLSEEDRSEYQEIYNKVRHLISLTRQQLSQALKQKIRRRTIRNRYSGELDPDTLNRIPAGKRDIFKEDLAPNKMLYRVSLLIDTSGSMDREKKLRALEGAVMLMESLEKLPGVVYEIVKFDSNPKVIKPYNQRVTPELKTAIVKAVMEGSGSTEAHVALKEAIERSRLGRGEKLIIMVNDGDPDYNFDRDQYRAMIKANKDVEVHGVGLGPQAQLVLDLFPPGHGWWLKDAADFAKNLRSILKRKLMS